MSSVARGVSCGFLWELFRVIGRAHESMDQLFRSRTNYVRVDLCVVRINAAFIIRYKRQFLVKYDANIYTTHTHTHQAYNTTHSRPALGVV